ncbi:MAG: HAD hydrolase family protein [Chlorobi bacterium]|nr:HAD hydrolase family protein [Chlorobiota bacterium]
MNGTLTLDGILLPGIAEMLTTLSAELTIHVLTADTFGTAETVFGNLPVRLEIIGKENQAVLKWQYLQNLGPEKTAAIGNGMNDYMMLADAALGIAVLGYEGLAGTAMTAANVIASSIGSALDLLLHPTRLAATLRN